MEKLIYINKLGREIELSRESRFKIREIEGLGGLTSSFMTTTGPFQDGSTCVDNGYFESRLITIEFAIVSDNLTEDIRDLNSILNPKLGDGVLKYVKDSVTRTLRGIKTKVLPELPTGKDRGISFQVSSVIFECFDPYFVDDTETESEVASQYDLFIFDLSLSDSYIFDQSGSIGLDVMNIGDVPAPVTVLIEGPLSAPITVINTTTGESIIISTSVPAGSRLIIDTDLKKIDVRIIDITTGAESSAFQYIDIAQTVFWSLVPGTNNLVFTHGEELAESVLVKHRNRFVGV
jgi:hypothetical protein